MNNSVKPALANQIRSTSIASSLKSWTSPLAEKNLYNIYE